MTFSAALRPNSRPIATARPIHTIASSRLSSANCGAPQPNQFRPANTTPAWIRSPKRQKNESIAVLPSYLESRSTGRNSAWRVVFISE